MKTEIGCIMQKNIEVFIIVSPIRIQTLLNGYVIMMKMNLKKVDEHICRGSGLVEIEDLSPHRQRSLSFVMFQSILEEADSHSVLCKDETSPTRTIAGLQGKEEEECTRRSLSTRSSR